MVLLDTMWNLLSMDHHIYLITIMLLPLYITIPMATDTTTHITPDHLTVDIHHRDTITPIAHTTIQTRDVAMSVVIHLPGIAIPLPSVVIHLLDVNIGTKKHPSVMVMG